MTWLEWRLTSTRAFAPCFYCTLFFGHCCRKGVSMGREVHLTRTSWHFCCCKHGSFRTCYASIRATATCVACEAHIVTHPSLAQCLNRFMDRVKPRRWTVRIVFSCTGEELGVYIRQYPGLQRAHAAHGRASNHNITRKGSAQASASFFGDSPSHPQCDYPVQILVISFFMVRSSDSFLGEDSFKRCS